MSYYILLILGMLGIACPCVMIYIVVFTDNMPNNIVRKQVKILFVLLMLLSYFIITTLISNITF